MFKKKFFILFIFYFLFYAFNTNAEVNENTVGVSIGSTRLILKDDINDASVSVINNYKNTNFLVQSWIEDLNENKTDDLFVTPPLFQLSSKEESLIRVAKSANFPADREVAFRLVVRYIPALSKSDESIKNKLQFAVRNKIKIFIRPKGLEFSQEEAFKKLTFEKVGSDLVVHNNSPYVISLAGVNVNNKALESVPDIINAYNKIEIKGVSNNIKSISYGVVNDYGAIKAYKYN